MILTNENYFSREADKEYMSVSQFRPLRNARREQWLRLTGNIFVKNPQRCL